MSNFKLMFFAMILAFLTACGGGGGSAGTNPNGGGTGTPPPPTGTPPPPTDTQPPPVSNSNSSVASLIISSSAPTLPANDSSTVVLTVRAVDRGNALVQNAVINVSANNNVVLSAGSLTTGPTGAATVLMSGKASDQSNRISEFTASCTGCNASSVTSQIQVTGATVALSNTLNTLIIGGSKSSLTATVKNVFNVAMAGVPVSFAVTDSNVLGLSTVTAITNGSGIASVSVSGIGPGSASVNVSALGNAKAEPYSSSVAAGVLAFTSPSNNALITVGAPQVISVAAPGAQTVTFASTLGKFGNNLSSEIVGVVGGVASATLTPDQAGTASLNAVDNLGRSAGILSLFASPTSANKITLNASPTTLPLSSATFQSSVIVTARAFSNTGATDQSVANVPIVFAMAGGPGAGEFLSPAFAVTNSAGVATATFFAGTAASIANGITISAAVSGTNVRTGLVPSSNSLLMTIGGSALSVAVGRASVLGSSSDNTLYVQAYSVQVADAGGNPVANTVVTLRMQPFAFATGSACNPTATFCSEDINGNGSLDAGEDGYRRNIGTAQLSYGANQCVNSGNLPLGSVNGLLTPANSDGGSVPSTVTTDATGTASFNMTYLKSSAYWVVNRLTATVSSNGTESSSSSIFRLQPALPDVEPICQLPASPYSP